MDFIDLQQLVRVLRKTGRNTDNSLEVSNHFIGHKSSNTL